MIAAENIEVCCANQLGAAMKRMKRAALAWPLLGEVVGGWGSPHPLLPAALVPLLSTAGGSLRDGILWRGGAH